MKNSMHRLQNHFPIELFVIYLASTEEETQAEAVDGDDNFQILTLIFFEAKRNQCARDSDVFLASACMDTL